VKNHNFERLKFLGKNMESEEDVEEFEKLLSSYSDIKKKII
jgi:hypothetical protein